MPTKKIGHDLKSQKGIGDVKDRPIKDEESKLAYAVLLFMVSIFPHVIIFV